MRNCGRRTGCSGHDVAFKAAGADRYTVWATDSNGDCLTTLIPTNVRKQRGTGSDRNQDLNGDGMIGIPPAPAR